MTMTTPRPAPQQPWPSRREREGGRTRRETASVDRPVVTGLSGAVVTQHPQVAPRSADSRPAEPRRRPRHAAPEPAAAPSAPDLTERLPAIPRQRFATDAPPVAAPVGTAVTRSAPFVAAPVGTPTTRPARPDAPTPAAPADLATTRPAPPDSLRPIGPPAVVAPGPDLVAVPDHRDAAGRVPAPRPPRPAVGSGVRRGPSDGPTAHRVDGRTRVPRNGLGVAALCLGLVGLPLGLVPVTGFLAAGLGVLAVAFGIAGWSRTRSRQATNTGSAVTGAVVGLVALVLGVAGTIVFFQNPDRLVYDVTALTGATPAAVVSPIGE